MATNNIESIEMLRSEIHFSDYNPRIISEENKKTLKRGIKKFGMVGGVVVNKHTGYTVVSGHQRLSVMDEIKKYNPDTKENDYSIMVVLIDVDEKSEKELNILMNNPNAQGTWDYDLMRQIIPDIDYKDAGLTENDLDIIGVDYLMKTEDEDNLAEELNTLMSPVQEVHKEELAENQADRAAKVQHMKDVKAEVKELAKKTADNMDAYVMLSFDSYEAKKSFMNRFGYNPEEKFIKGEVFDDMVERVE